jgi:hypothetical protein
VVGSSRDQQVGVTDQGLREREAAPLPTGELADLDRRSALELHGGQHTADLGVAGHLVVPLLEHGDVLEESEHRHAGGELDLLRQEAEPAPDLGPLGERAVGTVPEDRHRPGVRDGSGREQPEERGLAGSIRSEQCGDAPVQGERDVIERDRGPVAARDVFEANGAHGLPSGSWCGQVVGMRSSSRRR